MDDIYDLAVAGGGFGGLMVVANIMRRKGAKPRIYWAEQEPEWGFGLAYSTFESCHLLNVPADKMGAWADGIDDFWRWVQKAYPGQYRADSFVPRMIYGQYLADIRERFPAVRLEGAKLRGAVRQDGLWHLNAGRRTVLARNLVLATGNPPIAALDWPDNDLYVNNFWRWRINEGGSGQFLPADGTVVIAGTGLSACDAVLSLLSDGYRGRIMCVSPHGRMPHVHAPVAVYKDIDGLAAGLRVSSSSRAYINMLRCHVGMAAGQGADWRAVVDGLRPHLTALWQALDEGEKARFMRHLWSRWNVHRHRMAPVIAETVRQSGQVDVVAGRIVEAQADGTVVLRLRGQVPPETMMASKILNCTGPSYRRMLDQNPLLAALKNGGYLKPGPLGLGVGVPDSGIGLYAMGTLMLGERLETTAVPELRVQAAAIASAIT